MDYIVGADNFKDWINPACPLHAVLGVSGVSVSPGYARWTEEVPKVEGEPFCVRHNLVNYCKCLESALKESSGFFVL